MVEAPDGPEALAAVGGSWIDVAVLDLHLPTMSGLDVLTELRRSRPAMHIIVLTGAGSEADRVLGLVSGADDYMVKPFSVRELAARIVAARRRQAAEQPLVIAHGTLRIDIAARDVRVGDRPLDLTRRECGLLVYLASNPGRTVSRDELLRGVWGSSADWQSPATITEHVRRVRTKLEVDPENPVRIVTVRGAGYRFEPYGGAIASVTWPPNTVGGADTDAATIVLCGRAIVEVSPAALELVAVHDAAAVIGRDVSDFVAPRSLGAVAARRHRALLGHRARSEAIAILRPDGDERLVEISVAPLLWEGQPAHRVTLSALGGDRLRLLELAMAVPADVSDAVIVTDAQLCIQSFNAAAEELYGWRADEVMGRVALDALPWLDDLAAERAQGSFQRDGYWHGQGMQLKRDGTPITVHASVTRLSDDDDQPVGIVWVNRLARPLGPAASRGSRPSSTTTETDIRGGIERGEFVVHYQPVVRLDTTRWVGAEALVRWEHPDRGLLLPGAFMEVAETSDAIVDLGRFVLQDTCRQWAAWHAAGHQLQVAVNLSGRQLADPGLLDDLRQAMTAASLPVGQLVLEVTETSLVQDIEQATDLLHQVAALGARVFIDDFGTGWASLTYLRRFPVHGLKIDRMFTDGLGTSATDAAIVSSVLRLARELGIDVVAEGIETAAQLAHLLQLGCELGQGYLFGRPSAASSLLLGEG
ncbi:MAG: hypothetical protein JWM47_3245 [Acidimicrobiales bacterium]|nr:hypothetical protein [Acidimicrobiales bacterium]